MQARMLAASHYQQALGEGLPSLREAMRDACGRTFRRLDRFAELAVLGSARCARGRTLDPACGIYFASAVGPVASNTCVQEELLRDRELPMPVDFIHTLGGSAGFQVASNLGLAGPDWFMGGPQALLAAMDAALTDLAAGAVPQAMVGVIEEAPLPLADQRRRLGVADDVVLAEGSHWWLLEARAGDGGGRTIAWHDYADAQELAAWLATHAGPSVYVGLARDLDAAGTGVARTACPRVDDLTGIASPFHASVEAAWFAAQCMASPARAAVLVANGRLLHVGA